MRVGIIAKKLGMSSLYDDKGIVHPITLLHVEECQVIQPKTIAVDGYNALQIGAFEQKLKKTTKPLKGHFVKYSATPKHKLAEFRVSEKNLLEAGTVLTSKHFVVGQFVDVSASSIGKGFAGWMKRWGFHGLRASHGVSLTHRSGGSTGQRQDPGRVEKGKKMPGQMGAKRITQQNLKIIYVDHDKNIIAVRGSIPGFKQSLVLLRDSIKKPLPKEAPLPTFVEV